MMKLLFFGLCILSIITCVGIVFADDVLPADGINNCSPDWYCSKFGDCLESNVKPCLDVSDGKFCGLKFDKSLSDFDVKCEFGSCVDVICDDFCDEKNAFNMDGFCEKGECVYNKIEVDSPKCLPDTIPISVRDRISTMIINSFNNLKNLFAGKFVDVSKENIKIDEVKNHGTINIAKVNINNLSVTMIYSFKG